MLAFLVGEALRDLRRAGRVAASAILLITLALGALGGFWLLSANLGRAVGEWRERVKLIVYLRGEPSSADAAALVERVRGLPGVASVRFVGKAEALGTLREVLGKDAAVADQLLQNPLPASLEIIPTAGGATPAGAQALIAGLTAMPETEEVGGGVEWIERFARGRRLVTLFGLGLGGVLGVAAILTVTTATTLVLYARRDEMEIMRLVGAPEHIVRLPLLLQGMTQGLLGALLAVWILFSVHLLLAPRLEPLVAETLGLARLTFLTPLNLATLVVIGTLLGGLGGLLARGRATP